MGGYILNSGHSSFPLNIAALLSCNSRTIKFTLLKHAIQWIFHRVMQLSHYLIQDTLSSGCSRGWVSGGEKGQRKRWSRQVPRGSIAAFDRGREGPHQSTWLEFSMFLCTRTFMSCLGAPRICWDYFGRAKLTWGRIVCGEAIHSSSPAPHKTEMDGDWPDIM